MARPQRVLVVGGGIAGLATARALLRHGIEAAIVERGAAWSHPGAGMYLPANSVRALGALGRGGGGGQGQVLQVVREVEAAAPPHSIRYLP